MGICIYLLGHSAVSNYLYSYEVAYRHALLVLMDEVEDDEVTDDVHRG